jgi:hypothetical protein
MIVLDNRGLIVFGNSVILRHCIKFRVYEAMIIGLHFAGNSGSLFSRMKPKLV